MKNTKYSYDEKCFELARYFLDDIPGARMNDREDLAQILQTACEDCCQEIEARAEFASNKSTEA